MSEAIREQFEAFMEDHYSTRRYKHDPGVYEVHETRRMWEAWQAAIASLTPTEGWVLVPMDLAESSMQLLYSASNGKENIFASTAGEIRDLLVARPEVSL